MAETGVLTEMQAITETGALTITQLMAEADAITTAALAPATVRSVTATVAVTAAEVITPAEGEGPAPATLPLIGFSGLGRDAISLAATMLVVLGLVGVEAARKRRGCE